MNDVPSRDETGRWERGLVAAFGADDGTPYEVPEQLGSYRIRGVLGEGGMGIVYLEEKSFPAREVTLKVVRPHLATRAMLTALRARGQLLGRVQHPASLASTLLVPSRAPTDPSPTWLWSGSMGSPSTSGWPDMIH